MKVRVDPERGAIRGARVRTVSRVADGMLRLLGEFGIVAARRWSNGKSRLTELGVHSEQIKSKRMCSRGTERDEVRRQLCAQTKRIAPTGYAAIAKGPLGTCRRSRQTH